MKEKRTEKLGDYVRTFFNRDVHDYGDLELVSVNVETGILDDDGLYFMSLYFKGNLSLYLMDTFRESFQKDNGCRLLFPFIDFKDSAFVFAVRFNEDDKDI